MAYEAGKRSVEIVRDGLVPSKILTQKSLENAVMLDLAIGGSTNATLHLPALAHTLGIELPISTFNRFNTKIPTLLGVYPNGPHGMLDFQSAGGVPGVMKRLASFLNCDCASNFRKNNRRNRKRCQ
jgi:dihydroxy-acid dehydratase